MKKFAQELKHQADQNAEDAQALKNNPKYLPSDVKEMIGFIAPEKQGAALMQANRK